MFVESVKKRHRRLRQFAAASIMLAAAYGSLAYGLLPWAWTHHERQRALASHSFITTTSQGIPGDPLNVGLVGSRDEVVRAMLAAGWYAADPLTWRTSLEIVGSVLLDRSYWNAPVSSLFYDGRREDLAFEKPAGTSPDRRHHVRFWEVLKFGEEKRPVWLGAASFDRNVGLSHLTGAITHHIAPAIDAERDLLGADLMAAGVVERTYTVSGIGPALFGRNGEGDRYITDGEILCSVLALDRQARAGGPTVSPRRCLPDSKTRPSGRCDPPREPYRAGINPRSRSRWRQKLTSSGCLEADVGAVSNIRPVSRSVAFCRVSSSRSHFFPKFDCTCSLERFQLTPDRIRRP